jgi:glycerol-3-phosphate cytidylyltransferase
MTYKTVITFGTFDYFHYGHFKILQRAKSLGEKLVVGVSSDELTFAKKQRYPICNIQDSLEMISAIRYVNDVFVEYSLEDKVKYILNYNANCLVMGDDWIGKFDFIKEECNCDVIYLSRTPDISTTQIVDKILTPLT